MKNPFRFSKKGQDPITNTETGKSAGRFSTFTERMGSFFNPEPQKQRVLRQEDFHAAGDTYYASVSAGYKIAQRILWLIFILFMVISLATNFREITYDNFFYLLRDFSSAVDSESSNYESISYEAAPGQHFSMYRGGVAVVSPSGISAFTATGRRTLQAQSNFSAPVVVSSDRYMLVYDTAGTTFSVYNSFARIYTKTLEYPITNACFGDDGSFAIVTRTADRRGVVKVYDQDFRVHTFEWDAYIIDIAIDSKNDRIIWLYYGVGNGTGETVISVRKLSTLEKIQEISLSGEFPLECGFLERHKFALVTNGAVRVFNDDFLLESAEEYTYYNGNITGYCVNEEGIAVSVMLSSGNEVIAFDKFGALLYNDTIQESVVDIGICEDLLFLKIENGVIRLNPQNDEEEFLQAGNGKMLLYNGNTAVICGESKAEYLVFDRS